MRVAIVHPYPAEGGYEANAASIITRDRALGSLLQELGHSVRGFKTTTGRTGEVDSPDPYLNWTFYSVDQPIQASHVSRYPSKSLVDSVSNWAPDFLLIKGVDTLIAEVLIERLQAPVGAIIGGSYMDRLLGKTEIALTEKPEHERFLARRMGGGRLIRLPKLVNPVFMDGDKRDPEFDIAVVGKFDARKNHNALKPLLDHDISIVLVGDGPLREKFEEYSRGRRANVTFCGFIDAPEVAEILKRSRVLVHPALFEGLPRAVVEAMASGTPSICIHGVVGWPLEDGVNSLLVSPEELLPKTLDVLADDQTLQRLSSAAVETFKREFSIEALREAAVTLHQRMTDLTAQGPRKRQASRVWNTTRFRLVDGPRVVYRGLRRKAASVLRSVESNSPL